MLGVIMVAVLFAIAWAGVETALTGGLPSFTEFVTVVAGWIVFQGIWFVARMLVY